MAYTKSLPTTIPYRYSWVNWNGVPGSGSGTNDFVGSRTGQRTPKWRALVKNKQNATSPYTCEYMNVRELRPFSVAIVHRESAAPFKLWPVSAFGYRILSLPTHSSTVTTSIDIQARSRAFKALNSCQSQSNAMQFLGEFHEVIKMFKSPFRSLRTYVDKYINLATRHRQSFQQLRAQSIQRFANNESGPWGRRRESYTLKQLKAREAQFNLYMHKTTVRANKAIADTWLEFSFGIKPLVNDVKELAEAAARFSTDVRRQSIVGSASAIVGSVSSNSTSSLPIAFVGVRLASKTVTEHAVRYKATLDWAFHAAFGSIERLVELSGFRWDKFVPTIYELLPWSFLVDYFTNLGTVIETGCATTSAVKWVVRTERVVSTMHQVETPYSTVYPSDTLVLTYQSVTPSVIQIVKTRFDRKNSELVTVPFQFELPGKATQYLNMLALWKSKSSK